MSLVYHQRTIDLLGITPKIDDGAVQALDQLEQQLKRRLPTSFREWYSLKNARVYIKGNEDLVLHIQELIDDEMNKQLEDQLFLIDENQSVCGWALQFNDTDDPPIVISDDDYEQWYPYIDTFSDFVYIRVWDFGWGKRYIMKGEKVSPTLIADVMAYLQAHYQQLPSSQGGHWPHIRDARSHRFMRGEERMTLIVHDNPERFELLTRDVEASSALLRGLRPTISIRGEKHLFDPDPVYLVEE